MLIYALGEKIIIGIHGCGINLKFELTQGSIPRMEIRKQPKNNINTHNELYTKNANIMNRKYFSEKFSKLEKTQ